MNTGESRRQLNSLSSPVLFALIATIVLSAWALFSRPRQPVVIGAISNSRTVHSASEAFVPGRRQLAHATPLPDRWPDSSMELAIDDPFRDVVVKAVPAIAPAQAVPVPAAAPVPTMDLRYWGRFAGPDGTIQTFVARGVEQPIGIGVGTELGGGWKVERVTEGAIEVVHPSSGSRAQIGIAPQAPGN